MFAKVDRLLSPLRLRQRYDGLTVLLPGLLVCGVIALAAGFLSGHYGGPQLLYALLIGMAFHFVHASAQAGPGIDFCARTALRLGVALLGARITFEQIARLGVETAVVIATAVCATVVLGLLFARLLGRSREEGLLSGGAVAICGASAALAIASVLPATRENERFTLLVVVAVTVLSTVAMVVYPFITPLVGLSEVQAGIFLGGTIHDVAQVVAAGMLLGPEAGEVATIVKLFRVMLLMPVVFVIAWIYRGQLAAASASAKVPLVPWFLLVFAALVLLSSLGAFPEAAVEYASSSSRNLLVLAIAAVGIKTSFDELFKLGWLPVWMLVGETLFIASIVLLATTAFGLGGR